MSRKRFDDEVAKVMAILDRPDPKAARRSADAALNMAVAWDFLLRYSEPFRVAANTSELRLDLFNGARVTLYGADNPDALRGCISTASCWTNTETRRPQPPKSGYKPRAAGGLT